MKIYQINDFGDGDARLICRIDSQVKNDPVDIYMVMDLPSGHILSFSVVVTTPAESDINKLLHDAILKKSSFPKRLLIANNDPAVQFVKKEAEVRQKDFESASPDALLELVAPVKESFGKQFFSPSSIFHTAHDEADEMNMKDAMKMIPDSYDPCPCASGKKYKFCCKPFFREIMEAMVAAEEGRYNEALSWIEKAKKIAGTTAEILCREAVVYSFFDLKKSEQMIDACLAVNPNHPRAHYIRGITLKEQGKYDEAVRSYENAIKYYPNTDHFHLNEVYNNLGNVFYAMGNLEKAKSAWEKALLYLPSDKTARENLAEFIYKKPINH